MAQVEGVVERLERDRVLLDARRPRSRCDTAPAASTSESYASSSVAAVARSSASDPPVEVDARDLRHLHA